MSETDDAREEIRELLMKNPGKAFSVADIKDLQKIKINKSWIDHDSALSYLGSNIYREEDDKGHVTWTYRPPS